MRRKQPRHINGVGDAGIHAVAGVGYPKMRGVAADEHPTVAETVGHEAAAYPIFPADNLVVKRFVDAKNDPDRPVAIDGVELGFMRLEVIVDQPSVAAVDCDSCTAAARIERQHHPGGFISHEVLELWRFDQGRLYALHDRSAGERAADQFANPRFASVTSNQEGCGHTECAAGI